MSITWNGVTSDSIGVIVERMPNRYIPARRISPKSVPGRNGDILSIDRSFPNVEQEYEVYLSAETPGLPTVARACAEWLMAPAGYAELKDSYDNSVFREAVLVNGFDIENVLNQFGRCTITFSCKPQKFLYTGLPSITIDPTGDNRTYTGNIVTFEATASDNIASLTVPFSPIQSGSGTPSPDNVRPISGRTGLNVYVSPTTVQADATTYAVDWTSQAGTAYGGTLDLVTSVLTVDRAMVDLGTLNWYDDGVNGRFYSFSLNSVVKKGSASGGYDNAISSCYASANVPTISLLPDCSLSVDVSGNLQVYNNSQAGKTGTEFASAMSGVQLCYELATPITYQLTPHEVETLVGENNIWADTNEAIAVEVSGPSKLDNPTPFDALPLLTVSGEGAVAINDRTILIHEAVEDFEIDCESGESDDNSKIYCMDFPVLHGGRNLISCDSTITSLSLIPRWWTL